MEQNNVQKITKNLLTVALIMQIIYLLSVLFITMMPQVVLILWGHSGNYDFPFDSIHFGGALVSTLLFLLIYAMLLMKINNQKSVGIGFGILLGIYTYGTYFVMDIILNALHSYRLSNLINDQSGKYSINATIGENVSGASMISSCCNWAKVWFFTAIVFLFISYGIYCFYCRSRKEQYMS